MSKTWKTRPLDVRVHDRRDRGAHGVEVHDHADGVCNLLEEEPTNTTVTSFAMPGKCAIVWEYNGAGVCGCRMCTDHYERREDRRRRRWASKQQLRDIVRTQEYDSYLEPSI